MKKLLLISLIVILLGLGYFVWQSDQVSDVNNTGTESQAEVTDIVNDSSNNLDVKIDENKNKSEVKEEKVFINTVTGENVPEGFYDEILADGYTYNNPASIPEDWIIKSAGDGYPATIDYYKFFDEASESQTLPGKIGSKTAIPDYMYGYSPRTLDISFRTKPDSLSNQAEFTKWFKDNYGLDFLYVTMNNSHNYGGRLWSIYITQGDLQDIKAIQSDIINNYHVRVTNLSLYLPKYRGTDELADYIKIDNSSYRLFN